MSAPAEKMTQDTRERILDAAESLFIERGFSATSLRAIATRADVNLAATNYHFGSKMGLLGAAFHRAIEPINEERLKRLDALEQSGQQITIQNVLEALFRPLVEASSGSNLLLVMGRIYSEPESITQPILEQEFSEVVVRFQSVLTNVLPQVSPEDLRWRFHLMIGSMIHLMKFQAPLGVEPSPEQLEQGVQRLIEYSAAGLTANGAKENA